MASSRLIASAASPWWCPPQILPHRSTSPYRHRPTRRRKINSWKTTASSTFRRFPLPAVPIRSILPSNRSMMAKEYIDSNLQRFQDELFEWRSEEHTSELQSRENLVCRLLLEKKKH